MFGGIGGRHVSFYRFVRADRSILETALLGIVRQRECSSMHRHHFIDYIEFDVRDMNEAQRFYAAAFGWRFTDYGPRYCGIQGDDREQGGFTLVDEVKTGGPLVVLFSEDLPRTLEAVEAAGGRIVTPPFDFPGGRRFEFMDPSGNVLGVWSPAPGSG